MQTDYVQRFLFENLDIRGRLACLTGAWQRITEGRGYPERVAALLGHSVALTTMLAAGQKDAGRITLQVQGSGAVRLLVADCTADLKIRGLAQHESAKESLEDVATLLGGGRLALTFENLANGQIYQSLVPLEGVSMAEIFVNYLQRSEQRTSFLRLFAVEGAVCGLMLEKLPGADAKDPDGWTRVVQLAATLTLSESVNAQPYDLLVKLFPEELLRVVRLDRVTYHCPFNVENVERVLRGLGRAEVESILAEQGEVVVKNEMCNHEYRFNRDDVEALFA